MNILCGFSIKWRIWFCSFFTVHRSIACHKSILADCPAFCRAILHVLIMEKLRHCGDVVSLTSRSLYCMPVMALCTLNEVTLRQAMLVALRWMTVHGYTVLVFNQPPRCSRWPSVCRLLQCVRRRSCPLLGKEWNVLFKGTLRRRIAYIFFGPSWKYILSDIFL